jgi:hypothetical protein
MCLQVSYKKKVTEEQERNRIRSWIRIRIHWSEVRIRIRIKMLRIANTGFKGCSRCVEGVRSLIFTGTPYRDAGSYCNSLFYVRISVD